jgi:lactate permease
VTTPPPTITQWLPAAMPIIVVFVLMVGFRWGGNRAGLAGWLTALLIGSLVFQGGPELLLTSQLKAVLLTLYVLYIIWMALLLFRVVDAAGAIQVIGRGIVRLTSDRVLQLLLLAWVFSAFLQGVAGFGVPIAVVAPILIGLGFDPVTAVAGTAVGHSWSVTFGDVASSFNALIASTGLGGTELAPWSAGFLGIACLGCGAAVAYLLNRWQGLRHGAAAVFLIGGSMALTQYLLATRGLWNLAGFAAGMVGLLAGFAVTRLPLYRSGEPSGASQAVPQGVAPGMGIGVAILPYLFLILIVALAELWRPLHQLLNQAQIAVDFPQVSTGLGWVTPAASGRSISLFGHAGALLAYASVFATLLFHRRGWLQRAQLKGIVRSTVRSAVPSSVGIASMVGMAMIMDHCGMTGVLARGLSSAVGDVFPLLSPFIGLLGAFMTGSNTNSNVVFAPLQQHTAELAGISVLVVLAAQTTGGSLGSMLAPAKVIVGCSTAGLAGQEGRVMRVTAAYGLLITIGIGIAAWLATR